MSQAISVDERSCCSEGARSEGATPTKGCSVCISSYAATTDDGEGFLSPESTDINQSPFSADADCSSGSLAYSRGQSTPSATVGLSDTISSKGPKNRAQVQRAVQNVGLPLGVRLSRLRDLAEVLLDNGFENRASLIDFSDEIADNLGIPVEIATALRHESCGPAPYVKTGRVQKYPPIAAKLCGKESGRSVSPFSHISAGYPTYEASPSARGGAGRGHQVKWAHTSAGFPHALRTSLPSPRKAGVGSRSPSPFDGTRDAQNGGSKPSRRRSESPQQRTAMQQHMVRQEAGRELREQQLHEMRISSTRREWTPDAWRATTSFHSPVRVTIPEGGPARTIAGFERIQRCQEVTGDIGPVLPAVAPDHLPSPTRKQQQLQRIDGRPSTRITLKKATSSSADQRTPSTPRSRRLTYPSTQAITNRTSPAGVILRVRSNNDAKLAFAKHSEIAGQTTLEQSIAKVEQRDIGGTAADLDQSAIEMETSINVGENSLSMDVEESFVVSVSSRLQLPRSSGWEVGSAEASITAVAPAAEEQRASSMEPGHRRQPSQDLDNSMTEASYASPAVSSRVVIDADIIHFCAGETCTAVAVGQLRGLRLCPRCMRDGLDGL